MLLAAPLAAYISPQVQTVDVHRTAFFNCTTEGHPQISVSWLKDGQPLTAGPGIKFLPGQVSRRSALLFHTVSGVDAFHRIGFICMMFPMSRRAARESSGCVNPASQEFH